MKKGDSITINRRRFLTAASVPLAAAAVPRSVLAQNSTQNTGSGNRVRVGLIGAGANVQTVQIPGFRAIAECEILAVANRSLASSQQVATQFNIPRAYGSWQELLADDDVDAVLIGTWPYAHHAITLAALDQGKHVLCQARMANNATEARDMLAAELRHPDLVCQLVPTSTSYTIDNAIRGLLQDGYVGEVLSVEIQRLQQRFADFDGELDWRHDSRYSGYNTLNLGSTYESMMRWLGRGNGIMAMTSVHVPFRRDAEGASHSVSLPDHVDVLYRLANGAQVHMRFSETTGLAAGNQTWIHGSEGTIHVDGGNNVFAGRLGDSALQPVANPPDQQAYYRVEQEFVNAILGREEVSANTFEIGVHYMEFTEAVHRSARQGEIVHLPL